MKFSPEYMEVFTHTQQQVKAAGLFGLADKTTGALDKALRARGINASIQDVESAYPKMKTLGAKIWSGGDEELAEKMVKNYIEKSAPKAAPKVEEAMAAAEKPRASEAPNPAQAPKPRRWMPWAGGAALGMGGTIGGLGLLAGQEQKKMQQPVPFLPQPEQMYLTPEEMAQLEAMYG